MFIGANFLALLGSIAPAGTFWLYICFYLIFIMIIFLLPPKTKGVTLVHIEKNLMSGKKLNIQTAVLSLIQ